MRKLPIVVLLTIIFTVVFNSPLLAQRRPSQRTGSARAAYGEPVDMYKATKKKSKRKSKKQIKKAARKKNASPLYRSRSKNPWVN